LRKTSKPQRTIRIDEGRRGRKTMRASGYDIGRRCIFKLREAIAQRQLALFYALHLQPVRRARVAESFNRGVEIAMFFAQALDLPPHFDALGFGQLLLRHPARSVDSLHKSGANPNSSQIMIAAAQVRKFGPVTKCGSKRDDALQSAVSIHCVKELIALQAIPP
jgi:hypothetical protein